MTALAVLVGFALGPVAVLLCVRHELGRTLQHASGERADGDREICNFHTSEVSDA